MVKIGKRGAIEFLMCDRIMSDDNNRQVLAKLIGHEIGVRKISFAKHF